MFLFVILIYNAINNKTGKLIKSKIQGNLHLLPQSDILVATAI